MKALRRILWLCAGALAGGTHAADYYVSPSGNDADAGSAAAPFATVDHAFTVAGGTAGNTIHLLPGTYTTDFEWGFDLKADLVGEGAMPEDVVLQSAGNHRTLRTNATARPTVRHLTLVGEGTYKADRGGAVAMGGGLLVDCIIRDGTCTEKGANVVLNGSSRLACCRLVGGSVENNGNGGSLFVNSTSAVAESCLVEKSACGGVLLGVMGHLYGLTVVSNLQYGVWAWTANQVLVNCVVAENYNGTTRKEWFGNQPNGADALLRNCAIVGSTWSKETYPTLLTPTTSSIFANYAKGDYRPKAGSVLVNGGGADPRDARVSDRDLAGCPRLCGTIDIGCYERQERAASVTLAVAEQQTTVAPATVTLVPTLTDFVLPESVTLTYDFGDGARETVTGPSSVRHTYAKPGAYAVTVTAANSCEEESAEAVLTDAVRAASATVYVTPGNARAAFPYDTPATGYADVRAAVDAAQDGGVVLLGAGVHGVSGQLSVTNAVVLRGCGTTPDDVILRNTGESPNGALYRVLELKHAEARAENLALENGRVRNQYGATLRVQGGTVSNCIIRGGVAVANGGDAAGGAVSLAGTRSVLTHCILTNNVVQGTSANKNYAGGAVFLEYGAKEARLSNLLIAQNRYEPTDAAKSGTAGIRFGGSNERSSVENCTVADNTVSGALPEDSAGVFCTSWSTYFRNNLIVRNCETGKDGRATSVKLDFSSGSGYSYRNNVTDDALIESVGTRSLDNRRTSRTDQVFVNPALGDYRLRTTAPGINRGTDALTLNPSVDLSGRPRVFGGVIDVGCYECARTPGFRTVLQ